MRTHIPFVVKVILDLLVLGLFALMLYAVIPVKARATGIPAYDLVMASYPSDRGHTISWRSYTDVFRAPYPTEQACDDARDYVLAKHEAHQNTKTMATQLADVFCLKNPGATP